MNLSSLEKLVDIKALPSDVRPLTDSEILERCISVDEFLKLKPKEKMYTGKIVICNNPIWAVVHRVGTYSCDKDHMIYKTSVNNNTITKYRLQNNRLEHLGHNTLINLKEKDLALKEEKKMAEVNNQAANDAVRAALDEMNKRNGGVHASGAFQGGTAPASNENKQLTPEEREKKLKKDKRKEAAKQMISTLSNNLDKLKLADASALQEFNYQHGRLEFYVVSNDPKLKSKTKKVQKLIDGNPVLTDEAKKDASKMAIYAAGEYAKLKNADFEKTKELEIAQTASATPKLIAMSIPIGGIPSEEEINKESGVVDYDDTNTDTTLFTLGKDLSIRNIIKYFGGQIKEADRTVNGRKIEGRVVYGAAYYYQKDTYAEGQPKSDKTYLGKTAATKYVIYPEEGKLIQPWNAVPRKRFKTVEWSTLFDANKDLKQQAINSLFVNLFNKRANNSSIYDDLNQHSKDMLTRNEETGNISCTMFDNIANMPKVKSAYSTAKNVQLLSQLEIPLKDANGLGSYIEYDILSDKNSEDVQYLNPDTAPEFAEIRACLSEGKTLKQIVALAFEKASGGKRSARGKLSNIDSRKMVALETQGKLTNISVQDIQALEASADYSRYLNEVYKINKAKSKTAEAEG